MNQTLPPDKYEVIVVDDASTDDTQEVVATLLVDFPRLKLRYARSEGRGLNVARNVGLGAAVGDPIVFVDDDVAAPPSWLLAFAVGSQRYPDAGCLGGPIRLRLEGPPPRLCQRDQFAEFELHLGDVERLVDWTEALGGGNLAVRRSAIAKVGMFNELLSGPGDESEWESRLMRAGGRIVYLPDAWVWHRRTAEDLQLWALTKKRFRRGREDVRTARALGHEVSFVGEVLGAFRFIGHGIRRLCTGGLLSASQRAGRVWALVHDRTLLGVMAQTGGGTHQDSSGGQDQASSRLD